MFLRKNQPQFGRSMIEMLGVLAIVGVLSVGGIAGYSKAMKQIRYNKALSQWNQIIAGIERYGKKLYVSNANQTTVNLKSTLTKTKDIPEEMIQDNSAYIYDAFDHQIWIYDLFSYLEYLGFRIYPNGGDMYDVCRLSLEVGKQYYTTISFIGLYSDGSRQNTLAYGRSQCTAGSTCLRNLSSTDIINICSALNYQVDDPNIIMVWYH